MPGPVVQHPELDRWIAIEPDGRVSAATGKVEIGQGIKTALALIVAEELGLELGRIDVRTADTRNAPDEGVTAGSMSVETSGAALRVASAVARELLLQRAAQTLGVPTDSLHIDDGHITSTQSNSSTDYWSLQGGRRFAKRITEVPETKAPASYRLVGQVARRLDLPAKLRGEATFVHDIRLPDMAHARVVRGPTPYATLTELRLEDFELRQGVRVVRNGSFVAVACNDEARAVRAAALLQRRCRWRAEDLPVRDDQFSTLRQQAGSGIAVVDGTPIDAVPPAFAPSKNAAHSSHSASYSRPYQMHASLGPSAALAHYCDSTLTVWCHSQAVEALRRCLADVLALAPDDIHVKHREGAGCYGHNGADDVALDASIVALAMPEVPVLMQWTREQEHRFEPFSPTMIVDLCAQLDEHAQIVDWHHQVTSFSHAGRPNSQAHSSGLLAASALASPLPVTPRRPNRSTESGAHRNAEPIYGFETKRITKKFSGLGPMRSSSLRSLGGLANVFAIESFMDELAVAAKVDAFEFRFRHLTDERARAVLQLLRDELNEVAPGHGRGVSIARYKNRQAYAAVAVDVSVADSGEISLENVLVAADAGRVIDPDGARNQLEGAFIQAASWTLLEAVAYDESGVTSTDWETYPILRFDQVPSIRTVLVARQSSEPMGVGEAMTIPTPAAIANAVFDAAGVRMRHLPFTRAAVLEAAGGN